MHELEGEELPILGLHDLDLLGVQARTLVAVRELHLDVAQVEQVIELLQRSRRIGGLENGSSAALDSRFLQHQT